MNAEPSEAVYGTMTTDRDTPLVSAHGEPAFTTWKIREDGEHKQTLDYMFHTPDLEVVATLGLPTEEQIGVDRLPNMQYPSDHLSLLADFTHISWQ